MYCSFINPLSHLNCKSYFDFFIWCSILVWIFSLLFVSLTLHFAFHFLMCDAWLISFLGCGQTELFSHFILSVWPDWFSCLSFMLCMSYPSSTSAIRVFKLNIFFPFIIICQIILTWSCYVMSDSYFSLFPCFSNSRQFFSVLFCFQFDVLL